MTIQQSRIIKGQQRHLSLSLPTSTIQMSFFSVAFLSFIISYNLHLTFINAPFQTVPVGVCLLSVIQ